MPSNTPEITIGTAGYSPRIEGPTNEHGTFSYPLDNKGNRPNWITSEGKFVPEKYDNTAKEYIPRGKQYELETNPGVLHEDAFDLENLRIIDPQVVREALKTLEKNYSEHPDQPPVCILATGGTIAASEDKNNPTAGLVPQEGIEHIIGYAGHFLPERYTYAALQFPTLINSSQMKVDYLSELVISMSWMYKNMSPEAQKNFHGFLITHGTDTMAPSATRLAMMLGANTPFSVGVTGSQAGIDNPRNEIAANLGGTINVLDALFEADRNTVFLYMGGNVGGAYNPSGTMKISDRDILAFSSPAFPKIYEAATVVGDNPLHIPFADTYKEVSHRALDEFQPTVIRGDVTSRIINADMDIPPDELAEIIKHYSSDVNGIILRTYGVFTFDQKQLDAIIKSANERGIDVYACSPFPTGNVNSRDSDAIILFGKGVIPLHMMPHAAQVKLMIAKELFGTDRKAIRNFMANNNYVGEQTNMWRPGLNPNILPKEERQIGQPRETLPKKRLPIYPME